MRVISKSLLKEFWDRVGCRDAEQPLKAWYVRVSQKSVVWKHWGDVKSTFRNADYVGNCVVFDIGGNKYRLVTRILYSSQKVFTLKVMTHKEYDLNKWKSECGCYSSPPKKTQKH